MQFLYTLVEETGVNWIDKIWEDIAINILKFYLISCIVWDYTEGYLDIEGEYTKRGVDIQADSHCHTLSK